VRDEPSPDLSLGDLLVADPCLIGVQSGRPFLDSGTPARALSVVATVSLSIWAILEVVRGDSPFRRVPGGVVLAVVIVGLVRR
jgi:hypothetical protein